MDFFIRHYEKLILVICLLLLLFSLKYVSGSRDEAKKLTEQVATEVKTIVRSDNLMEEMSADSFESLDEIIEDPLTKVDIIDSPNGRTSTGLLEGGAFIICKNLKCGYILPYSTDVCPWCHTAQEKIGPEMPEDYDLDKDGIPDIFEKATTFLHYRYRYDAMEDYDSDGFLNIEEYRAGTALDDPNSRPSLAYLLRVAKAEREELPVTLKRVKPSGSANPRDWKANFNVAGGRAVDVKMNGAVPNMNGFKVTEFSSDQQSVTISDGTDTFVLTAGAPAIRREGYSITLRYLANHIFQGPSLNTTVEKLIEAATQNNQEQRGQRRPGMQQNMGNMGAGMGNMGAGMGGMGGMQQGSMQGNIELQLVFDVKEGDVFALKKAPPSAGSSSGLGGSTTGRSPIVSSYYGEEETETIEFYQMLELLPGKGEDAKPIIRVQRLTEQYGVPDGDPIEVVYLDPTPYFQPSPDDAPNHDYLPPQAQGTGAGMGGMPGMGGMRGM